MHSITKYDDIIDVSDLIKAVEAGENEVEQPVVGGAVVRRKAGAVHAERDGQVLQGDVVDDLIVGALQEGRINGAEWLEAFARQTGRERHRMLLGDADVEGALGEGLLEQVDAGARWHRRSDADDLLVFLRFLDQALAEHRLILAAMLDRDAEGAEAAMRAHLLAGQHAIQKQLDEGAPRDRNNT